MKAKKFNVRIYSATIDLISKMKVWAVDEGTAIQLVKDSIRMDLLNGDEVFTARVTK